MTPKPPENGEYCAAHKWVEEFVKSAIQERAEHKQDVQNIYDRINTVCDKIDLKLSRSVPWAAFALIIVILIGAVGTVTTSLYENKREIKALRTQVEESIDDCQKRVNSLEDRAKLNVPGQK